MEGMVKVKINDIKDSENILKTILEQKGFSEDKPDVEKAVSAFMEFSNYKFECETDDPQRRQRRPGAPAARQCELLLRGH